MKINKVSMIRSALRKLPGWSSICHSMAHRIRPGKCLNRTEKINYYYADSGEGPHRIIFEVFRRGEYSTEKPRRKGKMVEYSTMHVSL